MSIKSKKCIKCEKTLPISNFSKSRATLDNRCKECVKNVKKGLIESSAPAIEYDVFPLDLENPDWQLGKPAGSISQRKGSFSVKLEANNIFYTKCFSFSKYGSVEGAFSAAEEWRKEMSIQHNLTRNRIKVVDPNTIQVELTKGCIMTTDIQFSDIVQKYSLVAGKNSGRLDHYAIIVVNRKNTYFHKYITGFRSTVHINKDSLDNRLSNLRNKIE